MAGERSKLWKCPECGRAFARREQWHSCLVRTVDHHFRGKDPQLKKTYEKLVARLKTLGPLRVDAVKTSINLVSRHHFGGLRVGKDRIRLGFLATDDIDDERIVRRLRVGPNRVAHTVILRGPGDVDARLMGWLKRAYALQSR